MRPYAISTIFYIFLQWSFEDLQLTHFVKSCTFQDQLFRDYSQTTKKREEHPYNYKIKIKNMYRIDEIEFSFYLLFRRTRFQSRMKS